VQPTRTTIRRRRTAAVTLLAAMTVAAAGAFAPAASAAPANATEAGKLVEQAAQQLSAIDEQLQQAKSVVDQQQQAAAQAAQQAATAQVALAVYEPQLRAIAQSGYTGQTRSRVAAFLTSESAADLVQQLTTLDMIATHTEGVIAEAAAAKDAAAQAQAAADQAAAQAQASLTQLQQQQAQLKQQADEYQAEFEKLTAAEQAAVTTAVAGPAVSAPPVAQVVAGAPNEAVATAIRAALAQVGKPYVYGSMGPRGFDCSGLTAYAYAAAGISLQHSSRAQASLGVHVSRADLEPGDLVFFYSPISHVGLYIGNGMMVHARTFGHPVAVTSVDMAGYNTAVRIVR
jgi:cell wall-associated NlpC family hydrolase